jgi:hypothetical protein
MARYDLRARHLNLDTNSPAVINFMGTQYTVPEFKFLYNAHKKNEMVFKVALLIPTENVILKLLRNSTHA